MKKIFLITSIIVLASSVSLAKAKDQKASKPKAEKPPSTVQMSDQDKKDFDEWKASKSKQAKIRLSDPEIAELSKLRNAQTQLQTDMEQALSELSQNTAYQKFEAARARLELVKTSISLALAVACSEHGIKPAECRVDETGAAIEKIPTPPKPNESVQPPPSKVNSNSKPVQ